MCECEHVDHVDHGPGRCEMVHQRTVKTIYGTFKLCLTCYERGHMQLAPVSTPLPEGMEGF